MEAFLKELLPELLGARISFRIYTHRGKTDLKNKLGARLRAYRSWLPPDHRIIVLLDRDDENCAELKEFMEQAAISANLKTRAQADQQGWQVANRIAVEELEAWYFGDWASLRACYPNVSPNIPRQAPYRAPDDIRGGTWEALERILQRAGYFETGLRKIEIARQLGKQMGQPQRIQQNTSPSFVAFCMVLLEIARLEQA